MKQNSQTVSGAKYGETCSQLRLNKSLVRVMTCFFQLKCIIQMHIIGFLGFLYLAD